MLKVLGNETLLNADYVVGMLRNFAPAERNINLRSIAEREISNEISEAMKTGGSVVSAELIFNSIFYRALDGSCFK